MFAQTCKDYFSGIGGLHVCSCFRFCYGPEIALLLQARNSKNRALAFKNQSAAKTGNMLFY
jgi:hypothetical protein